MIAQGTPAEIMRGETLEMIYGIPMGILPHPAGAAPVSLFIDERLTSYFAPSTVNGDGAFSVVMADEYRPRGGY